MTAYCGHADAYASWRYAIHMLSLAVGSRRFETLAELYWIESQGGIP